MLIGRLTKDPELKYTTGDKSIAVATFLLAVDRYAKGGTATDFIRCKAFGKTAEILDKYAPKGKQICLIGEIRTSDYEKDGRKFYMTEVAAKSVELLGGKVENENAKSGEEEIPPGFSHLDNDIPFE